MKTLRNAEKMLFLRVFLFSLVKRLKKMIQNGLFLQSQSLILAIFYNFSFTNLTNRFHQTFKKKAFSTFFSATISKLGLSVVMYP